MLIQRVKLGEWLLWATSEPCFRFSCQFLRLGQPTLPSCSLLPFEIFILLIETTQNGQKT